MPLSVFRCISPSLPRSVRLGVGVGGCSDGDASRAAAGVLPRQFRQRGALLSRSLLSLILLPPARSPSPSRLSLSVPRSPQPSLHRPSRRVPLARVLAWGPPAAGRAVLAAESLAWSAAAPLLPSAILRRLDAISTGPPPGVALLSCNGDARRARRASGSAPGRDQSRRPGPLPRRPWAPARIPVA